MPSEVQIPVSIGELLDKITILEIKNENITDEAKLINIRNELKVLIGKKSEIEFSDLARMEGLQGSLKLVNKSIWDAEDEIRDLEREGAFGDAFLRVARSIYRLNDSRASVKREINILSGSAIVEEKGYSPY